MTTLPRTPQTCTERIHRIIAILRDLETRGDWNPGIRVPLLRKLELLVEHRVKLMADK